MRDKGTKHNDISVPAYSKNCYFLYINAKLTIWFSVVRSDLVSNLLQVITLLKS